MPLLEGMDVEIRLVCTFTVLMLTCRDVTPHEWLNDRNDRRKHSSDHGDAFCMHR